MDIKAHLEVLLRRLALIDEKFDDQERDMIRMIASANGVPKEETEEIISAALKNKIDGPIALPTLSDDEKFEYLYNIV